MKTSRKPRNSMQSVKILCISDDIDPLIYSDQLKERFSDIDLVLSAGDLDLSYYGFIVSNLNKPLLFVFGNHNLERIGHYRKEYNDQFFRNLNQVSSLEKSYGSTYIGTRVRRVKGLIIAGLGGSMRYNRGQNQFTETQMFLRMVRLFPRLLFYRLFYGRWVDILLTHAPPFGIQDRSDRCHTGFKSFLHFIRWFKPRFLVHGHIHLYNINEKRCTTYLQTKVVNAYQHTTIQIEDSAYGSK